MCVCNQNVELNAGRDAMFRIFLIVCISLMLGITAKPLKTDADTAAQDTREVKNTNDELWQVEPPEDMDKTSYDADANMLMWKSASGTGEVKLPIMPEEDLDELYHPSTEELLKNQLQVPDVFPVADTLQEDPKVTYKQEPEEDGDDIDHPDFPNVAFQDPEPQIDDVYHKDETIIVPLQPEEDMDDVYHKDPQPVPYQDDSKPAAPVNWESQQMYTEPEEDLDYLYHP